MLEQCVCEMREQCVGEFSITFTEGTKSEGERERERDVRKKQRESVNSLGTGEGGGQRVRGCRTFSTTPEIYSNLSRKFSSFY